MLEKLLLRVLLLVSVASTPYVLKRKNLLMLLTVFFAKGVICTLMDSFFIKRKMISYPVRPFSKTFETNILFDLLFYPLLSVVWVRMSYNSKPAELLIRSLFFSVPMTVLQWALEKKTKLFEWKSWTILHTFACISFTLLTIRGFVGLLRMLVPSEKLVNAEAAQVRSTNKYGQSFKNYEIEELNGAVDKRKMPLA
ncbi:CBO0543 family protein [Paenibacillus silvestris]|uniref:CBO0543 family protein n=1 Tax=Paenibacillus silvestris TaxID=2606219 RepID=UPI0019271D26|nr:CBO0543 family protein [Paenibacillus silvestris]